MEAYPSETYNQYKCDPLTVCKKQCVSHNISSEHSSMHLKPNGKNNVFLGFFPSKKIKAYLLTLHIITIHKNSKYLSKEDGTVNANWVFCSWQILHMCLLLKQSMNQFCNIPLVQKETY